MQADGCLAPSEAALYRRRAPNSTSSRKPPTPALAQDTPESPPPWHLGRWVVGIIAVAVVGWAVSIVVLNPRIRWNYVWQYLFSPNILNGVVVTLWVLAFRHWQAQDRPSFVLLALAATVFVGVQAALWQFTWLRIAQRGGHWRAIAECFASVVRYPVVRTPHQWE